jgi:hypothetical protein
MNKTPLDFYHIGIYWDAEDFVWNVLAPDVYEHHGLIIYYDDQQQYQKEPDVELIHAIKDAQKRQKKEPLLEAIPIIVMKEGEWMRIESDADAIEAILRFAS